MRKYIVLAGMCLVVGVSGCGASPDSLVKEQIAAMNDLSAALESKAPEAKVKEAQKRMEDAGKRLDALKLSEDAKKQLLERHKDELTKAGIRFLQASMGGALQDFGKAFGGGMPGMPPIGKAPK
jgi:hypothetical protein